MGWVGGGGGQIFSFFLFFSHVFELVNPLRRLYVLSSKWKRYRHWSYVLNRNEKVTSGCEYYSIDWETWPLLEGWKHGNLIAKMRI